MIKTCTICGKEFDAQRAAITCSPECSAERARRYSEAHSLEKRLKRKAKEQEEQIIEKAKARHKVIECKGYAERQKAQTIEMFARVKI